MEEQFILRVPPSVAERLDRLLSESENASSSEDKSLDLSFSGENIELRYHLFQTTAPYLNCDMYICSVPFLSRTSNPLLSLCSLILYYNFYVILFQSYIFMSLSGFYRQIFVGVLNCDLPSWYACELKNLLCCRGWEEWDVCHCQ